MFRTIQSTLIQNKKERVEYDFKLHVTRTEPTAGTIDIHKIETAYLRHGSESKIKFSDHGVLQ
jgi:hypothetical protein